MNNILKIIKGHNKKKITSKPREPNTKMHRKKKKDDVTRPLPKKLHLGLAEEEWKSSVITTFPLKTRDIQ